MGQCICSSLLVIFDEFLIFIFAYQQDKIFSRIKPFFFHNWQDKIFSFCWLIWPVPYTGSGPDLSQASIISTNNCMCILPACFSGSLKLYSLCLNAPLQGLFIWGDVVLGCLINLLWVTASFPFRDPNPKVERLYNIDRDDHMLRVQNFSILIRHLRAFYQVGGGYGSGRGFRSNRQVGN